jgi:mannose-6-phosphate isomerase class I
MRLQPFKLDPVLVERPWGGRRLAGYGKRLAAGVWIGESWEVADLPSEVAPTVDDPRSRVVTGSHAGAALSDLIALGDELLGPVEPPPMAGSRCWSNCSTLVRTCRCRFIPTPNT